MKIIMTESDRKRRITELRDQPEGLDREDVIEYFMLTEDITLAEAEEWFEEFSSKYPCTFVPYH